jgi:cell division protein FtsB
MHFGATYPPQGNTLQVYEDPEVARLQRRIKTLVEELAALQQQKSEIEQQIETLHTRHHQELRSLVVELLQLRRKHRQSTQTDSEPSEPQASPYEDKTEPNEHADSHHSRLSPAERHALKEMFRRASKLCHPDLVPAEFKAEANVIFIELKTAYEEHNLQRVEEILHLLERGERLARQPSRNHDKDKLRAEITYLEKRVRATRLEIETLKQSSAYQKLLNIEDWDDYFDDLKAELQRKINRLRRMRQPKQPR